MCVYDLKATVTFGLVLVLVCLRAVIFTHASVYLVQSFDQVSVVAAL